MAQEMNNGIKRFASSNLLQVRNSQMLLPSGVNSASSRDHSGGMVSLLPHPVPPELLQEFSQMKRKTTLETVTGNQASAAYMSVKMLPGRMLQDVLFWDKAQQVTPQVTVDLCSLLSPGL